MTSKEIKHLLDYICWRKEAQYIKLTRDPKGAVEFICEQVKEG